MKRLFLIIPGILIIALVVIQFFPPQKNYSPVGPDDFLTGAPDVPADIRDIIKVSCYDCHSNQTNYPWYSRVAPVSWLLASHITGGKEHLNFSTWGALPARKKISTLQDIGEAVDKGEMPLRGYVMMHRNARLSSAQTDLLDQWIDAETRQLMGE